MDLKKSHWKYRKILLLALIVCVILTTSFSIDKLGPLLKLEFVKNKTIILNKNINTFSVILKKLVNTRTNNTYIDIVFCSKSKKFGKLLLILPNCYLYAEKASIKRIYQLMEDIDVLAIEKQKIYRPLLFRAIPVTSGNLTIKNITFNNQTYPIPFNFIKVGDKIINGSGIKVAIIDTGINPQNPWFKDTKIKQYIVYYDNSNKTCVYEEVPLNQSTDNNGHGTHVAGIVHSVAPGAELIILDVDSDNNGDLSEASILCAIKKAILENVSIISMSLGSSFWFFSDYPDTAIKIPELNESFDETIYNWTTLGYLPLNILTDIDTILVNVLTKKYNKTFVIAAGNEAFYLWHYNDTVSKNKVVKITVNNYVGGTEFLIRWYNWYSKINITIYNSTQILAKIYWNGSYLIENATNIFAFYLSNNWSGEQILEISLDNSDTIYINITANNFTEFDFYEYYSNPYTFYLCYYLWICNKVFPHTPYSTLSSPGNAKYAITVGSFISSASGFFGHISSFSSRGPLRYNYSLIKPEVVAPGDSITSANYNLSEGIYLSESGTSMATPFISGVIALIKQIAHSTTPSEIKEYLKYITEPSAYNLSLYDNYTKGYGLINITKAILYLPKIEIFPTNETLILRKITPINITIKNLGYLRAKVYYNNETFLLKKNESKVIEKFNKIWAGIYNYSINLSGEFLNSPLIKNITIIALPNISSSLKIHPIKVNKINLTFELNNTGFYTKCYLFYDTLSKEFNVTEYTNTSVTLETNGTLKFNYNITCFNLTIKKTFIYINISPIFSIFDKITPIIIYYGNLSDVKINNKTEIYGIDLGNGSKTINITYIFNNKTDYKTFNTLIFKPNALIEFKPINATNETLTINSSLIVLFSLNYTPQNLTLILKVNNETVYSKNKITNNENITLPYYFFKNGTNLVEFLVKFRNETLYYYKECVNVSFNIKYDIINTTYFNKMYFTNKNISIIFNTNISGSIVYGNNTIPVNNTNKIFLNFSKEGVYNVTINVTALRFKLLENITIVFDRTPPNVTLNYSNTTLDKEFYTNLSKLSLTFFVKDNYIINKIIYSLNNKSKDIFLNNNSAILNIALNNLTYGKNNFTITVYDLAGNSINKTIKIVFDNESPRIIINQPKEGITYFKKVPINLTVLEDYLDYVNITINNKPYSFNKSSIIVFFPCNSSVNLTIYAKDKAGNFNLTKILNINCNYVGAIKTNETEMIDYAFIENGSVIIKKSETEKKNKEEKIEENRKIIITVYEKNISINISFSNNTKGFILLKYNFLRLKREGYKLTEVLKEYSNGTTINLNYNIANDTLYIPICLDEDPEVIIIFSKTVEKIETIESSSSNNYSGGGSFTSFTKTPSYKKEKIGPYFNLSILKSNDTIVLTFTSFNISNKTISVTLPYIKKIVIYPKGLNITGKILIKKINISLWPNFVVDYAYKFTTENATVYIELERVGLCKKSLFEECKSVNISDSIDIVFGKFVKIYKPLKNQTETKINITTNKSKVNITGRIKTKEFKERTKESVPTWTIIILTIIITTTLIFCAIRRINLRE